MSSIEPSPAATAKLEEGGWLVVEGLRGEVANVGGGCSTNKKGDSL